jgi:hypothetical protein
VTWAGPLADARGPIVSALRKLLDCPEVFRPFVIVQERASERFVQFAGSTERGLLFDVPARGIVAEPCPSPEEGAALAITNLRAQGVPAGAVVLVTFESTRSVPTGGRQPAQA